LKTDSSVVLLSKFNDMSTKMTLPDDDVGTCSAIVQRPPMRLPLFMRFLIARVHGQGQKSINNEEWFEPIWGYKCEYQIDLRFIWCPTPNYGMRAARVLGIRGDEDCAAQTAQL
jgi:hypothetical protein